MIQRWRSVLAVVLAASLLVGPGGCTVNPATGKRVFTGGVTEAEEKAEGQRLHAAVLRDLGPRLADEELQRYVDSVGQLLARTTERRDLGYTSTVIDSGIVNAFATPGGYVYITRGLLALLNSEAELAAVLGHELGHITALHHARARGQSMLSGLGVLAAGILAEAAAPGAGIGEAVVDLSAAGAFAYLRSFSRDNEFESDDLGLRYLARAGYDAGALAGVLQKTRLHERFQAKRAGRPPGEVDRFDYTSTHPAPIARIERAQAKAAESAVRDPMVARDVYFDKIEGIIYGARPEQGFVRGRHFLHPTLRFRFSVPDDFVLRNTPQAVIAAGPGNALIFFTLRRSGVARSPAGFLHERWSPVVPLGLIHEFDIDGMPAAVTHIPELSRTGVMDMQILAVGARRYGFYEAVFLFPRGSARLDAAVAEIEGSLREVGAGEAAAWRPRRIATITARRGDTQESLARRMAVDDLPVEHFRMLNGLQPGEPVLAGRRVKIVVE